MAPHPSCWAHGDARLLRHQNSGEDSEHYDSSAESGQREREREREREMVDKSDRLRSHSSLYPPPSNPVQSRGRSACCCRSYRLRKLRPAAQN